MTKKHYDKIILEYLDHVYPNWLMSYELIAKNTPFGFLGPSADRIARTLAEKGLIEREGREEGKFYARYRAKKNPVLSEETAYELFEPKVINRVGLR